MGVKHWLIFIGKVFQSGPFLLFSLEQLPPSPAKVREAEHRLLLFAAYLSRDYTPGTVQDYISHVKARHFFWLGFQDFAGFGIVFTRISIFMKILRKQSPRQLRHKIPFTKHLMARVWGAIRFDFDRQVFGAMVFWAVSTMAFQQLMRLNELVTMTVETLANENPIMTSHVTFFNGQGAALDAPASVKDAISRIGLVAYAIVIAPPSKADPTGRNDPFHLPMCLGNSQVLAPCWSLWFFLAAFPIPLVARQSTPLFRATPKAFSPQIKHYAFDVSFKAACRSAGIRYEGFGKHRYRVGGLNALQDAGCSVAQIMAAGHWRSDAWMVYSRRNRVSLMHYSNMMLR